jgi:hypothetical protein
MARLFDRRDLAVDPIMTVRITRVLSFAEKCAMEDDSISRGWYRNDRRMFTPGMAWYEPWYYSPLDWAEKIGWGRRDNADPYCQRGDPFLSIHYWQDWADKRPPIAVVLPNGEEWEIDRKSSNGTGWIITGDLPAITASPSIAAGGYHGFLRGGEFTPDVDRPNQPDGIWPYPEK